jgi:hypothetical protein
LYQALRQGSDQVSAQNALRQANDLVDFLAAQLADPLLKISFSNSSLVKKIQSV